MVTIGNEHLAVLPVRVTCVDFIATTLLIVTRLYLTKDNTQLLRLYI